MKFRTEIDIKPWSEPIDYSHNIVCLGSCFATNIAEELSRRKFRVVASPTGILFNPASIAQSMRQMVAMQTPNAEELMEVEGRYVHYNFHSALGRDTREDTITTIGTALQRGKEALESADMVIVTLGTAWVYRLAESGAVVANCHKQPQRLFRRELLTVEECVAQLEEIVALAPRRVLFTVSPVRHVGEGLEDNSLSKAILRVAVDIVCRRNAVRVAYFPSYEILIGDLRDYRFYAEDLAHPSRQAVEYIVEKFCDAALSPKTKTTMAKVEGIVRAVNHRPNNPRSEAYRTFCKAQLRAIAEIEGVDLSEEKRAMEQMLQINL
jgi:hypothetical protein